MPSAPLPFVETLAAQDEPHRPEEDLEIESQRLMLDVPEVELDPLGPRQRSPAVDLRPAGDPGLDGQPPALALRVLLDLDLERRPRTDDRHFAAQDVPQVAQLVQRISAQHRADAGNPVITFLDR